MRSSLPNLVGQHGDSPQENWEVENVCGLHWPKQSHPKDGFPLPQIDQLVDSLSGHEVLSFLDAYNGYNQIPMLPDDV